MKMKRFYTLVKETSDRNYKDIVVSESFDRIIDYLWEHKEEFSEELGEFFGLYTLERLKEMDNNHFNGTFFAGNNYFGMKILGGFLYYPDNIEFNPNMKEVLVLNTQCIDGGMLDGFFETYEDLVDYLFEYKSYTISDEEDEISKYNTPEKLKELGVDDFQTEVFEKNGCLGLKIDKVKVI